MFCNSFKSIASNKIKTMETNTNTKSLVRNLNKPAYIIFVLIGIYFLVRKDFSQASMDFGLALAFDPFNIKVPFHQRPFYQQAWLIVHLSITLALFVLMLLK
jgi:hypothetical protein